MLADTLARARACPCTSTARSPAGARARSCASGGPRRFRRIAAASWPPTSARRLHPTAGAVLVAARPPLARVQRRDRRHARDARRRSRRRSGAASCRACGRSASHLAGAGIVQVSTNIEDLDGDHAGARSSRAVRAHATVTGAELVAPAPRPRSNPSPPRSRCAGRPCWTDRYPARPMAQTKRKRRSKHRGNAAGVVESRGRTGRRPTEEELQEGSARDRRASAGCNKPPTWNSAFLKAAADGRPAVRLHAASACSAARRRSPSRSRSACSRCCSTRRSPTSTDRWVYQRAQRKKSRPSG